MYAVYIVGIFLNRILYYTLFSTYIHVYRRKHIPMYYVTPYYFTRLSLIYKVKSARNNLV